jgi:hypothetical protein
MNIARIVALPLVIAFVACSSESAKPDQDTGLTGDNGATDAPDTNPDGVAYPTQNLGTTARSGTKAGNRINNYKFYGYPDGNVANGLQPMSLAQFFDPQGTKYKLIHLQASGVWCVWCQRETQTLVPMKAELDQRKVAWIITLAEGAAQGTPSKQSDLDKWIAEYKAPFNHVLDPGNHNLGVFYDAAALPWNANVNAKTMEILESGTGAVVEESAILQEVDGWLAKIDSGELDLK